MEQKRKSPFGWFKALRLSQKIALSMGLLIFCSNLLILLVVFHTATSSLREETCEQLQGQLTIALSTVSSSVEDITDLMVNLSTTSDLADYVSRDDKYEKKQLDVVNGTNEAMRVLIRANAMIDYVALLRMDTSQYLYNGATMTRMGFWSLMQENYQSAQEVPGTNARFNLLMDWFSVPELNLYYPVYEKHHIQGTDPLALLVVGINTEALMDYVAAENENLNIRILTAEGTVLASGDSSQVGQRSALAEQYQGSRGEINSDGSLTAYQYDAGGALMADGSISRSVLFSDIRRTALVLSVVILLVTAIAIAMGAELCERFYEPIREMLTSMRQVTDGDLGAKLRPYEDEDFRQLSEGFNAMTASLQAFIAAIYRQEAENTEIRLNALQSQIKPHFLYNTLECIHWQALLEGAPESSRMVLALSRYYRLCLNKGQDIVSLNQELEHTESYVSIQNMRFDDILEVQYDIPEELRWLEIPKITLQPLVENAIYHGIKPVEDRKGHVCISARLEENTLVIRVADDGIGMTQEEIDHLNGTIGQLVNDGSYGVKNVHKRLEIRYGAGSGLFYRRNEAGGITVTVRLPARELAAE